ncbi:MAG: hypothetical protein ABFS35_21365 [Bacteroidota bacterium]
MYQRYKPVKNSMQRPEAQDAGTIILTGFEPEIILSSVRSVIEEHQLYIER